MKSLPRSLIENTKAVRRSIRRRIKMQGHSNIVRIGVRYLMKAQFVRHIRNLILAVRSFPPDLRRRNLPMLELTLVGP